MKKFTLLLLIGCFTYALQAQKNAGLQPFKDFCKQCEDGSKDYYSSNCRGMASISNLLQKTENIGIQKADKTIEKIIFAFKNVDKKRYGITAKIEILNKKGAVLHETMTGAMYFLDDLGNLNRIISTQQESFTARALKEAEAVLFAFPMNYDIPSNLKKLTIRTTTYRVEITTRELVEMEVLEEKIKL